MRVHTYVIAVDSGGAPNYDAPAVTLAVCKPRIRKKARIGDLVLPSPTTGPTGDSRPRRRTAPRPRTTSIGPVPTDWCRSRMEPRTGLLSARHERRARPCLRSRLALRRFWSRVTRVLRPTHGRRSPRRATRRPVREHVEAPRGLARRTATGKGGFSQAQWNLQSETVQDPRIGSRRATQTLLASANKKRENGV